MDFFVHLIVQKYTVIIYYHNINTYCLMHAVMLCTSLQNASLLSSALRFWMLSPCVSSWSVCWDLEVTFSFWQNMSLEITHFNTRMHSFIKDDSGLGIFCSSLWNQINENWGPNNPPQFPGRIRNPRTDLEIWCDVSVKGWEKKTIFKRSMTHFNTSSQSESACVHFPLLGATLLRSKDLTRWFNKLNKNIICL